jgi:ribosome-associated toxin RatA of RatAB toxin-antitoxin module
MADTTSATMTIAAPAGRLMDVIADFAAYPRWVDTVRSAEVIDPGQPGGRPELVRFTLEAGPIKDGYVLRYTWEGDRQVRWELAERGSVITELTGGYLLAGQGDQTQVTYDLRVGLAVPFIGLLKRRAEKTIIDAALKGLQRRAAEVARGEIR